MKMPEEKKYYELIAKQKLTYKSLSVYTHIFRVIGIIAFILTSVTIFFSLIGGLFFAFIGFMSFSLSNTYKTARKICFEPDGSLRSQPSHLNLNQHEIETTSTVSKAAAHQPNLQKQPSISTSTQSVSVPSTFSPFPTELSGYIKQYEYTQVPIYIPDESNPSPFSINDSVVLKQDHTNAYDSNSIALYNQSNLTGYLLRGNIQTMANDYLNNDNHIVIAKADTDKTLCLAFFKHIDSLSNKYTPYAFNLIGLSKKDSMGENRIDNLSCCDTWDSVDFYYDSEQEKYIVSAIAEIGELSKSSSEKINELHLLDNAYYSFITDINYDEDNKCSCTITIYSEK